ncbi:unnamed protein product [Alopecurus aequalis]
MALDMDELRRQHGWSLQLQSGQEMRLTPPKDASEPLCVTDVFLAHPESAASQGAVAAFVEIGTQNRMLAVLSSEKPRVVLQTPVVLDEEFCFYLMRVGGENDADADADPDAVVVQFQGYALPSANTQEEEDSEDDDDDRIGEDHDEDDEDATGSDYEDYDRRAGGEVYGLPLDTVIEEPSDTDDAEEVSDGEVNGKSATTRGNMPVHRRRRSFVTEDEGRSFGGPGFAFGTEHARRVSPEAVVLGIFVVVYLAMVALFLLG